MGGFIVRPNMPGWLVPKPRDHGHGPLAMVVESVLHPGRLIAMHEHRNDEIVSWVPDGVMRHDDKETGPLVVDSGHLMIMNAGCSFWHSEETLPSDPPLRMLQIFVRPREADLDPRIQHGPIAPATLNIWRHLFGPEDGDAPFFVRNEVDFFVVRLDHGAKVDFPVKQKRDLYFYVFSGQITVGDDAFAEGEQGLLLNGGPLSLVATTASQVVAFLIDPTSKMATKGTVGDNAKIPPALAIRALKTLARLRGLLPGIFARDTSSGKDAAAD